MKLNRKNSLVFLFLTFFSVLFVACGSDDDDDDNNVETRDTEKPQIQLTLPAEGDEYVREVQSILINGTLTDNQALDTCYVFLSYTQKSASGSLKSIDDPNPFDRGPVGYSLSGKEHTFTNEDPFGSIDADSKPGEYIFSITVKDAAGNEASEDITISIIEQQ
ncbi:DUF4625 domain-containing protein [Anaerophaga thermohalophila]|uniref:DUF4625 domain-containing protein n=1 Tax=Anaerophaga thermohalophila TaxID=177400 RepID=UPI000237BD1E|nr:DUF4625 domain-containing protein [Anaerophaga thermohalophila]